MKRQMAEQASVSSSVSSGVSSLSTSSLVLRPGKDMASGSASHSDISSGVSSSTSKSLAQVPEGAASSSVAPSTCSDVSSGVSPPTSGLVPKGAASDSVSHSGTRSDMHSPAPNSGARENPRRPNNTPSPQRQPPQTVSRLFSTPPAMTSTAAKGKHKQSVIILSDVEGDDSPLTDIGEGENLNTGKEHKKRKLPASERSTSRKSTWSRK
jgi:hypothetical protein